MKGIGAIHSTPDFVASMPTQRRRVLIVVSSYAPAMIADMHRARHLAWELPKLGWDVEVIAPDSSYQQEICLDDDSHVFFAHLTTLHYVSGFMVSLFRKLGIGSIGWRALAPIWRGGQHIMRQRHFDVVYLSTTHFPLFLLGRLWQREFDIPYVLDFHDPCHREPERHRDWLRSGLKHEIFRRLLSLVEAHAVRFAAGIVSVSPNYIFDLRRRYGGAALPWMREALAQVIPFAVSPQDFSVVQGLPASGASSTDRPRIVYVGAGGAIMRRSFSLLCAALAHLRATGRLGTEQPLIELYGTLRGWQEGDRRELAEVANSHGIGDLVEERPGWVSFRRSLELLQGCDGALILGVDDAGYMPSKLFPYAYSGKPLLATLRSEGPAFAEFRRFTDLGHLIWFSESELMPVEDAATAVFSFLNEVVRRQNFDRTSAVSGFLASVMAERHIALFEAVCNAQGSARGDAPRASKRSVDTI